LLFGHFEAASHGAEARLLRDLDRHPPAGTLPLHRRLTLTHQAGVLGQSTGARHDHTPATVEALCVRLLSLTRLTDLLD
jgi:hypothetical protein